MTGNEQRVTWTTNLPFLGVHAGCVLVLWTGVSPLAAGVGLVTLLVRMFGLTGGYHRYFCHHSFKTTRVFQFTLAAVGSAAAQKGPLWWAGHHRSHHRYSDTDADVHPPGVKGFYWAHMGWVMSPANVPHPYRVGAGPRPVPGASLARHHYAPPVCLAVGLFMLGTWLGAPSPNSAPPGCSCSQSRSFSAPPCSTT